MFTCGPISKVWEPLVYTYKVNIEKFIFYKILHFLSKCLLVGKLTNFVYALAQKLNFTCSFSVVRLKADWILVGIVTKEKEFLKKLKFSN